MKRDWDLVRKQLTDVEEENDLFSELPDEPVWKGQGWDVYERELEECQSIEARILGHLELLIDAGYVEGVTVLRSADGRLSYGIHSPRLTMAGHDLLDTMRSKTIWDKIKASARERGVELTFDVIKALGAVVVERTLR